MVNAGLRNAVAGRNFAMRERREQMPDFAHGVSGQTRPRVIVTSVGTATANHVGHVVGGGPDFEMIEPIARFVIATVPNDLARDVVPGVFHNLAVNLAVPDAAVTVREAGGGPFDTRRV